MRCTIYERISRNRAFLMGAAVLWLLMFHSAFTFSGRAIYKPFDYLFKFVGYGCVDIFMFLSGFGLYRSLKRNADPMAFYGKRVQRLAPSYLLFMLAWIAVEIRLDQITLPEIAGNLFCTGFWMSLPHQLNWYAQAIWLFYLFTPIFFTLLEKPEKRGLRAALLLLVSFLMGLAFVDKFQIIAICRVPIYLVGMLAGRALCEKKDMRLIVQIALIALIPVGLGLPGVYNVTVGQGMMWKYGQWWYPLFLSTPGLCILLSYVADGIRACFLRPLGRLVETLGGASFEIYIVQIALYDYVGRIVDLNTLQTIALLVGTALLGWTFKRVVDALMKRVFPLSRGAAA